MPESIVVEIKGVGPVLLERSRRARHIGITVKPFKGVRVAVPAGVSFRKALEFARERADWIRRHAAKMHWYEERVKAAPVRPLKIDKTKAKKFLTDRLEKLARQYGFDYNRVSIRSQRTRWGSCSAKNNISLNMKLLRLPDDLIDYVILHELVHTRVHNHGKQFWAELNKYVNNAKKLAKRLRGYEIR
jgi:predicted metal-dependent hydrolase